MNKERGNDIYSFFLPLDKRIAKVKNVSSTKSPETGKLPLVVGVVEEEISEEIEKISE